MIDKSNCFLQMMEQLALEYNTTLQAFQREGLTVTVPALQAGRRVYSHEKPFFSMATTGNSVVIAADERMHPFIGEMKKECTDLHRFFEFPNLQKIDTELRKYGYAVHGTVHMYLPGQPFAEAALPEEFAYQWFESEEEIRTFYPNEHFQMALSAAYNPDRPDVIALAAMDGEKIVGVAGASADTKAMWQVGIDVLPEYRGRGLGTALVHALCRRIDEKGFLPFYGTAVANIHSQNIALRCGFYPAWTETVTYKL